jgi:hypothetical protein
MDTTMNTTLNEFLASLIGNRDWSQQLTQISHWASSGQVERLLALGSALMEQPWASSIDQMVRQSLFDFIPQTLAESPGLSQANATLAVALMREEQGWPTRWQNSPQQRQARTAINLAQGQAPEVLLALFERHSEEIQHRELLACLVQEMALRSYEVTGVAAAFWQEQVVNTRHPLGWLPPALLHEERAFPMYLPYRGRGRNSTSWAIHNPEDIYPEGTLQDFGQQIETNINRVNTIWTEVELSDTEIAHLQSAVRNWTEESNGLIESRIFHSDVSVSAEAINPATLLSLRLECLDGITEAKLNVASYSLADALAILFAAAANGGAYNSGLGGAYGRLEAWHSASVLVGAEKDTEIGKIAAQASECAWYYFKADCAWFHRVAWDISLIAMRPDGRTIAVLAASDTD